MKTHFVVAVLLVMAGAAAAQPPVQGIYTSTDLGGSVLTGRYSESWFPDRGDFGNTICAVSWESKNKIPGTQWRIACPILASTPILLEDTVDKYGDGHRTWLIAYIGGAAVLDGTGPWGGGDAQYDVVLNAYEVTVTVQYHKGDDVSAAATVRVTGSFSGYPQNCLEMTMNKVVERGSTGRSQKKPFEYPDFKDSSCQGGPKDGAWGEQFGITVVVTGCTTPVERSSWGAVKSRYGE